MHAYTRCGMFLILLKTHISWFCFWLQLMVFACMMIATKPQGCHMAHAAVVDFGFIRKSAAHTSFDRGHLFLQVHTICRFSLHLWHNCLLSCPFIPHPTQISDACITTNTRTCTEGNVWPLHLCTTALDLYTWIFRSIYWEKGDATYATGLDAAMDGVYDTVYAFVPAIMLQNMHISCRARTEKLIVCMRTALMHMRLACQFLQMLENDLDRYLSCTL